MSDDLMMLPNAPTSSLEEHLSEFNFEKRTHASSSWKALQSEPTVELLEARDISEYSLVLMHALDGLERQEQIVLELTYVKGLTLAQAAYVMELPRSEVELLRERALRVVRRVFCNTTMTMEAP